MTKKQKRVRRTLKDMPLFERRHTALKRCLAIFKQLSEGDQLRLIHDIQEEIEGIIGGKTNG